MCRDPIRYLTLRAFAAITGCAVSGPDTTHSGRSPLEKRTADFQRIANDRFYQISTCDSLAEKDRAAILAMQGEYHVAFNFEETVAVQPGYTRQPSKQAEAFETVLVIENSPERIVLQHLLVSAEGAVIKHWRQDWSPGQSAPFEFTDDQQWEIKHSVDKPATGLWTQCVYEVSDAPRYCGTGKWQHDTAASTWTSDDSWRPLPRREYTVRDDYNALRARNRHTVTAHGWTHEQDNTKVIRRDGVVDAVLVREFGFNNYRKISGFDFSPAYGYWQATADFWSQVRNAWAGYFARDGYISLATEVDGMPVIGATFSQAQTIRDGGALPSQDQTAALIQPWVNREKVKD